MDAIKKFWTESLEIPEVNWIVSFAGLAILGATAFYVVKLFRDMALGNLGDGPSSFLSDFQAMRNEGVLEDEEFEELAKVVPKPEMSEPLTPAHQPDTIENTSHTHKPTRESVDNETPDFMPAPPENDGATEA